jgi:hypothetical protein
VRRVLTASSIALLLTAAASCGGGPGESLQDGAENGAPGPNAGTATAGETTPAPATTPSAAASSTPAGECWAVAEGCRCADEGKVVACKGKLNDFGDYVSCTGVRECSHGVWGACLSTNYVTR